MSGTFKKHLVNKSCCLHLEYKGISYRKAGALAWRGVTICILSKFDFERNLFWFYRYCQYAVSYKNPGNPYRILQLTLSRRKSYDSIITVPEMGRSKMNGDGAEFELAILVRKSHNTPTPTLHPPE